ncbi:hypothetical protein SHI21_03960 [Bacteriovorax sp. PP10]|uniref:Uncharacterized protein n=1 Tax=Bacteriovorax antarcticus TaxID=3088717 RepID=A0ABU5VQN0_9BACT|nr:hypothetical protein [Bacteriovorax sp. PP10]MEA9355338.1 hypothetical protein [Bacteriovorax sp. PP10]
MKSILLPVFLLASLVSSNAFASHAYRDESCTSSTHDLVYLGDKLVGGKYWISQKDQDQKITARPLWDFSEDDPYTLEDADVIFSTISVREYDRSEVTNDGFFDHEEWKTESTHEIHLITPEASKKLGLKQGDQVTFTCDESTDYPNSNQYP